MSTPDATAGQPGSASLSDPTYWWYRARSQLLETMHGPFLGTPERVLDVGSADGPSVGWMTGPYLRVTLDLHAAGLAPGRSVRGQATALPFASDTFDVVSAFDVVEHCLDDQLVVTELVRVLAPGGHLLLSVPAYQWAWSEHDVRAGHHRRYTRPQIRSLVASTGVRIERASYAFAAVFPFFLAERAGRRFRRGSATGPRLTPVSAPLEKVLLRLCSMESRYLRRFDLGFGSSVLVAATKPHQ